jgi:hypothetical protein
MLNNIKKREIIFSVAAMICKVATMTLPVSLSTECEYHLETVITLKSIEYVG